MLDTADVEPSEDPMVGRVLLGRYRVKSVLGEGGMGKVYLAEQKMGTATRKVAIKTLHPELSRDPQLVGRFHRECETVIELHHPNTVQFYDFGDLEDNTLFIVMEFIKGEDLARRLLRGALSVPLCDKVIIQICGSLAEAHQRGVVHRDLKPENVLLTSRGGQEDFVKVLDFGIAKRSEAEDESRTKLTQQGMVLGTPPYMSPEQFSGKTLDARSDIYSLGVMAYEMLSGRLPFEAKTPWEWATKHLTAQPHPIDALPNAHQIPLHKKNAVMRALAKNRDDRHPDVTSFMQEFTGASDPQHAWTLATNTNLSKSQQPVQAPAMGAASFQPTPTPHAAQTPAPGHLGYGGAPAGYATPSGPYPAQNSGPHQAQSSGPYAQAPIHPTPPPTHYPSGQMAIPENNTGKGLIVGLIGILVVSVLGVAAWKILGDDGGQPTTQNQQTTQTTQPPNTNNGGVVVTPPSMQPTPVQPDMSAMVAEPSMEATMVAEPTMEAETPMVEESNMTSMRVRMVARMRTNMTQMTQMTSEMASGVDVSGFVRNAEAALGSNNVPAAIVALRRARQGDPSNADVRRVQQQLSRVGGRRVGQLMMRGCPQAQALYRDLRSVGAHGGARTHFAGSDWCPEP